MNEYSFLVTLKLIFVMAIVSDFTLKLGFDTHRLLS